jgi:hypothetical protein
VLIWWKSPACPNIAEKIGWSHMEDAVEALWKICGELFNKVFHSYCGKVESLSFPLFSVEMLKRYPQKGF